jgi:hydroxyacylglutathione hydrolase
MRLARVGLEKVVGHLVEGARAWRASGRALATVAQIPVSELRERVSGGSNGLQVIDVRRPREYAEGHVPGATPLPLDRLDAGSARLDASRPMALVCGSGYRSSTAASLLRRRGFEAIHNVVGGTAAWTAAGYPVERAT